MPPANTEARFWSFYSKPSPDACWEFQKFRDPKGYGKVGLRNKVLLAHRVAWEFTYGPIPTGMNVLHRCDNPPCGNPAHLFLGSLADNNRDMAEKGRARGGFRGTHCKRGHEFNDENTIYVRHGMYTLRRCRECHNGERRKKRALKKLAGLSAV